MNFKFNLMLSKNIFIVNQNPDSKYDDKEGERYNFPTTIPNGKQIVAGDVLIINMSKKTALKMNFGEKRIVGIAIIDEVVFYEFNGQKWAYAIFNWYRKFDPPLTFKEIGGDPRINIQHAMNKIPDDRRLELLLGLIKSKL